MDTESVDQGGEVETSQDLESSSVGTATQEAPSTPEYQGQQQQPESVWSNFKKLPEFQGQDDRAIASHLYQAMQRERAAQHKLAQYQQYIPYAQEYLAHRPEFEKWKSSQSGQAQQGAALQAAQQGAQPQQEAPWWNPPQIKDSYKRYLTKDEAGRDVIAENAPLEAKAALEDWMQYRADFARKFLENPQETLGPMVEKLAQQQAEKIVQDRFETEAKQHFVADVEQSNRDWLFDSETGQVTPEGMLVHKYIDEARSQGIQGPEARWKYAVAMTERDMLAAAFDQQQASFAQQQQQYAAQAAYQPPPQQAMPVAAEPPPQPKPDLAQQNMEYLKREASRNPSRSAGTQLTDPRAPKPKRSFEQFFRDQASADGLI